jgi:subtilase family serine protease
MPDVSMNAAINGGVDVYTSFVAPSFGVPKAAWQSFGGTSCASPETAALVALAGEEASRELGQPVGIGALNPILYQLHRRDFNDIVSFAFGDSGQVSIDNDALYFSSTVLAALGPTKVPPVAVPGFSTTPGYDLATGLGSPRAVDFVLDVARTRVANRWGRSIAAD